MLNLTTRCGDLDLTFIASGIGTYEDIRPTAVPFDLDGFTVQVGLPRGRDPVEAVC